ncbi:MAG: PRC-barrel domain containing protein [Solirubrobacteraceae bacterium]
MFDIEAISQWRGQDVLDPEDNRVGRLEEIYHDRQSPASPGFACVKTGLFGRRLSFVPLAGASMARDHVRVAYPASQIKRAPSVDPDGQLTALALSRSACRR